jgi:hypothetical protein
MSINISIGKTRETSTVIRKCHHCGEILESNKEIEKCSCCKKSFLPSNYFGKVHAKNSREYQDLYLDAAELQSDDLIRGISVLW